MKCEMHPIAEPSFGLRLHQRVKVVGCDVLFFYQLAGGMVVSDDVAAASEAFDFGLGPDGGRRSPDQSRVRLP